MGHQPTSSSTSCTTAASPEVELPELSLTDADAVTTNSTPPSDFLQQQQTSSSASGMNSIFTTAASPEAELSELSLADAIALSQGDPFEQSCTVASTSSTGLDLLQQQQQQPIPSTSRTLTPSPTAAFPQAVLAERSSNASSCSTPVHVVENQPFLSSTPVNGESRRHHFRPCDILPIPRVSQTGPRIARPNKRLQEARNLTSEPEVKKIKEAHEAKLLKKQKQEEAAKKKTMVCANSKIVFIINLSC